MMSFIRGLIERASSSVKVQQTVAGAAAAPVALGRWGIQYDKQIIDRKITQANEDHCGCCVDVVVVGDETKNKNKNKNNKKKSTVQYEQMEDYLVPYVM
jgi:hypothetical protein